MRIDDSLYCAFTATRSKTSC